MKRPAALFFLLLCSPLLAPGACLGDASEPDAALLGELIEKAKQHAGSQSDLLRRYFFEQHEVSETTKKNGKVVDHVDRRLLLVPVKWGVEQYPLEIDGKPPTDEQIEEFEERNRHRRERYEERQTESPEEEEIKKKNSFGTDELVELLNRTDYRFVGQESVEGRQVYCLAFDPPKRVKAKGMEKKLLKHLAGTVCMDAETGQAVRFDIATTDKFRLKAFVGVKDFKISYRQTRVNDEIWLPSTFEFEGLGSIVGIKRRIKSRLAFSNFRKATVEMTESIHISQEELEELLRQEETAEPSSEKAAQPDTSDLD